MPDDAVQEELGDIELVEIRDEVERSFLDYAMSVITARALPDARSAATLGTERAGTGVVIGKGGLILTIGYLLVEADDVLVGDVEGGEQTQDVVCGGDGEDMLGVARLDHLDRCDPAFQASSPPTPRSSRRCAGRA